MIFLLPVAFLFRSCLLHAKGVGRVLPLDYHASLRVPPGVLRGTLAALMDLQCWASVTNLENDPLAGVSRKLRCIVDAAAALSRFLQVPTVEAQPFSVSETALEVVMSVGINS